MIKVYHISGTSGQDDKHRRLYNKKYIAHNCAQCKKNFINNKLVRVAAHVRDTSNKVALVPTCRNCNSRHCKEGFKVEKRLVYYLPTKLADYGEVPTPGLFRGIFNIITSFFKW